MRRRRALLALVGAAVGAAAAITACAGAGRDAATYQGVYRAGFETQAFWPADGAGPYWVEGDAKALDALDAAVKRANGGSPWGGVRVELEGALSPPGKYGHLNAYQHKLRVLKVKAVLGPPDDAAGARG
ncbi:MAG: hypothetical protein KJS97_04690 [Alphaproteobacteria bacterium]|nr:hypothetical protein [Alphaproteobacteria bacterium]